MKYIVFFSNHALSFILVLSKIHYQGYEIYPTDMMTITLGKSYLDSMKIVPYNLQKHHPIPADVLPNDSEALLIISSSSHRQF